MTYECPLCSTDFDESSRCPSSCPIARGCPLVRCPRCGYEFVDRRKEVPVPRTDVVTLINLPIGAHATIVSIEPTSPSRVSRLASFGIVPGSEVRLLERWPSVVLSCGHTSIAVEDEIGRGIYVTRLPQEERQFAATVPLPTIA